ncbi:condensation domain-containing protein, partial [Pseudoalteromonas umbrosa]|uniref:condensation domain-containing protein n=1 Tax=Pseudoalteromonas umbrosa TaxID=3048489 RepID=UPI0024C37168
HFTVKDLFNAQTIRGLTTYITHSAAVVATQTPSEGAQVLLPIQTHFFQDDVEVDHYNQAVMLTVPTTLARDVLVEMVQALYTRHDALRLAFKAVEGQWQGEYQPLSDAMVQSAVMTHQLAGDDYSAVSDYADEVHKQLNLAEGVLFKAVLIQHTDASDARLLLVLHHLVTDGVSWRILLEDLTHLFTQWQAGQAFALADKSSSYQQWGTYLASLLDTETLAQEREYWLAANAVPVASFNEHSSAIQGEPSGHFERVSWRLSETQTQALLQQCPKAYRTQVNELLLAGLLLGGATWRGEQGLRIALEGHGRETEGAGLDLSQTVGWFTSIYPLTLYSEGPVGDVESVICAVKEQYRGLPNKGLGYGVLKYLSGDAELSQMRAAELVFNYLGQFDQVVGDSGPFGIASESTGQTASLARKAHFNLSLDGAVSQGQLQFALSYDTGLYDETSMQTFMAAFEQGLMQVIAHCQETERGRYTPSDFPLARVSEAELQAWQGQEIEDIYPATDMQQGLLFHSLLSAGSYVTQALFQFKGLDLARFRAAWEHVIAQTSIFKTGFIGIDSGNAHQLVHKSVTLPWEEVDISGQDAHSQAEYITTYRAEDKARGFAIEAAPLMRVTVFLLGDERCQLLWTHHHALMDGWSTPLVFNDVT